MFYNAVFPKLASDTIEVHKAREDFAAGKTTEVEYEYACSINRSRIMNISWVWNNIGFLICCALSLAVLAGLHAEDSVSANNWGYSVSLAVVTGFWSIAAIPWFVGEKKRPGPSFPKGTNYLTFGLKTTWLSLTQAWQLKQTFLYLIASFLLLEYVFPPKPTNLGANVIDSGVGTSLTLIAITQTQAVQYSATWNTYFIMAQGASVLVITYVFYYTQAYFKMRTKTMLQVSNFFCVLFPLWGTIGIWTDKIGFHNEWEFWLAAGFYGFAFGCQYSYGQAFMAELVPKGKESMFFGLLGIVSKGSAWIGPIVSSAITDASGNQSVALIFLPDML